MQCLNMDVNESSNVDSSISKDCLSEVGHFLSMTICCIPLFLNDIPAYLS